MAVHVHLLLIVLCILCKMSLEAKGAVFRGITIAKGTIAAPGEFPHQVAIIDKNSGAQFCSGSMFALLSFFNVVFF